MWFHQKENKNTPCECAFNPIHIFGQNHHEMIPWCFYHLLTLSASFHTSIHSLLLLLQQSIPFNSICHSMKIKFLSPTDSYIFFPSPIHSMANGFMLCFDAILSVVEWTKSFHFFLLSFFPFPFCSIVGLLFFHSFHDSEALLSIDFWHTFFLPFKWEKFCLFLVRDVALFKKFL